jgi:hypothetical protein
VTVTWKFESLDQMANFFERKGQEVRKRVPRASTQSQHVMRAEAHAYEQCAMIVRNAVVEAAPPADAVRQMEGV